MVTANLRVDLYRLITDAISRGIDSGWYRAHKHTGTPDEFTIKSKIYDATVEQICEYIEFDDSPEK